MPATMLISALLVAGSLGALTWVAVSAVRPERTRSLANLRRGLHDEAVVDAATDGRSLLLARRLTPPSLLAFLDRQHARAGRPAQWPVDRLLKLKLVLIPVATAVILLLAVSRTEAPLMLLAVAVTVLLYFLPEILLLNRGMSRDQQIALELADTLDQMTIAVEAGLAFDAAMARAAKNGKGPMAEELTRTLQDMRMGQSRRVAFAELGTRTQVPDLRQFVRAVMQADANGISVGDVLRTQADEMRLKRRQRAEMKAQQVPVKVVMPLILCILPSLMIVIIGPAALSAITTFSGL